jgi:hypothetical protein
MKKRLNLSVLAVFITLCCANAQHKSVVQQLGPESVRFSVEADTAWTGLLKRYSGWFGGDGIYTIPLSGVEAGQAKKNDKTLIIFSDTMIGEVTDSTMKPGYKMIHNSVALLKGNEPKPQNISFYWDKNKDGSAESVFIPNTAQTHKSDYYWLGDGFVNTDGNKALYLFGYRVRNVSEGAFGFKEVGNTLIKLNIANAPYFTVQEQKDTPFYLTDEKGDIGSFGAGVYVNTKSAGAVNADGYIYVYGVRGMVKNLMVARVLPKNFDDYSQWRFWDGTQWVSDMSKVADITNHVSNELSVSRLPDGRYALIFQVDGMSPAIGMRLSNNLTGPFGPIIKLWDCKPDLLKNTFLVYNAKAHPSLSKPGELLISYNINSTEFINDLQHHPHLYRPRFIRVRFLK